MSVRRSPPPHLPIGQPMLRPPIAVALILPAFVALAGAAAAAEPAPAQALAGVERDVRVQQYIESAQKKREAGDFEQALADLRAANALVKKTRGDGHPDQLPLLDLAAEILVENGKTQEAEMPLQKAVAMREALTREGQASQAVPLAASLLLLGKVHAALGKYESVVDMLKMAVRVLDTSLGPEHEKTFQARRELARSAEIFAETLGPEHPAAVKALEELALVQAALGDWTGAAADARKISEIKQKKFGAADPETLAAVTMLTDLIAHAGAAAEALTIQADAIAAAEAADAAPAVLVPSLRHLGALHLATEDYSPAIDAYTRARDLAAAHLGADGAEPLIDRLHLVDVAQKRGDDDPWDAGFEQIVARLRELAGQGDPRAAEGLRLAAGTLLAADSFDRASELYREAIALDERLLGPAHVDVAEDRLGLGRCLVGNGDIAAAEALLRAALQTMQREHGPAHAATLEVVTRLAECAVRAGDAKAAEKYVAQILERRVPRQGAHAEEEFCRLVDAAAGLCEKAGDAGKGGALRDQLVAIRRAQFGESHEHVADVLVAMANARQAARDHAAATVMYEAGIAIYEAALGGEHPDIAAALLPLARAYRATGKNEVAERALRRALGIWEATVGPEHEVTLATVKPLALVLLALEREAEAIPLMERLLAGLDADPAAAEAEKIKLLTKLAEVRESLGAADAARRDLRRAIEIEMRLADAGQGGSATDLTEIARLQQLLGDEEAAALNLARARAMAAKLPDAQDLIAKIEATAKTARKPAAAAPAADKPAPPAAMASSAAVIAAARSEYRLGKRFEARRRLEQALGDVLGGESARDLDRTDLLVALADMRQRTTDYDTAAVLYDEARKIAAERGGAAAPRTLVIALRLLGIRQAQGQEKAATGLMDGVEKGVKQVFAGSPSAEAMDELREAVRRAEAVSLAAGDRKTARRLVEIGITLAGRPDRRATLAAIETLSMLLASGKSSSATALRARLLDGEMLTARRDDPLSARFLYQRGLAAEQAGDLAAAERDVRQALAIDEQTRGREHPLVAVDLLRLAAVRERAGDRAGATAARDRAVAIAGQAGRVVASDSLADLRALAEALGAAGETDAAAKLLRAAVDARLERDGTKSLDVARLLADSADIFKRRGNAGRAAELLSEAVQIADAVVGAGHHETLALAAKLEHLKRFGATDQFATRTSVPLAAAAARNRSAAGLPASPGNLATAPAAAAPGGDVAAAAPAQPLAADAADQVASGQPSSAKADQARRAFDAALHLYGGDPKKKGRRGLAKQGLENMLAYASMVEGMAGGAETGPPPETGDRSAAEPRTVEPSAGPAEESARPTRPREAPRTPFVAASRSGLRQRTALARQRAQGGQAGTTALSLDAVLSAAWSAHRAGAGEDAARACDLAVELAGKEGGGSASRLAETLDQVAAIATAQNDHARAHTWLERLGKLRWQAHGGSDPRTIDVAARLAAVLTGCGEYARARKLCDRVLAAWEPRARENPAALARALVVRGRIDLGLGDPAAAVGRARAAAALVADAWQEKGQTLAADEPLVRLQLAITALLIDTGDVEAARARAERVWDAVLRWPDPRPETLYGAAGVLARARRLAGDSAGALEVARSAGQALRRAAATGPATAVQLMELAAAERAAGDDAWTRTAREATAVLEPAARTMTGATCTPAVIDQLCAAAGMWLEAGDLTAAGRASAAALAAAATVPDTHPAAVRAVQCAARVAVERGDPAEAEAILAAHPAARIRSVPPVEPARDGPFLDVVLSGAPAEAAATREAIVNRRTVGSTIPASVPQAALPGGRNGLPPMARSAAVTDANP